MNYLKIINETISDGVGLRMSIYLAGCSHECNGCHNKSSWNEKNGKNLDDATIAYIINAYKNNPLLNGITFTGGDPLYNFESFNILIKKIKQELNCNIWVYTGYVFEEILNESFMKYIDVLVDGKFMIEKYSPLLYFKGSTNQRIIDVVESFKKNKVVSLIN
ncbi:MAG: anaerobic ribonucleoside-triphosphate reductase activating protein [Bacilli bacterium]